MKKLLALTLALAMVFTLCACGQSKEDVSGTVSSVSQAVQSEPETPAEPEAPAEPETPAEPAPSEAELQIGSVSGGHYENASLGIACDLDSGWYVASQEELAEMVGQTAEMFQSENFKEQMNNVDMFYDFYAQKPDGTQTINILIQNLGLLYGTVMDEETFVTMSTQNLEAQLEDAGFSNISWEINTIDLGGQTRHGMLIQANVNGLTYRAQQAYIKVGNYIAVITLGDFTGEGPASLAELFTAAQ